MAKRIDTIWEIKPHTVAKHEILRRYLGAWFPIMASNNTKLVYIDGFCGPGRYKGGELGSPLIALDEALKQLHYLGGRQVTFLFIDEDDKRIDHLRYELGQMSLPTTFSVKTVVGEYEPEFGRLLDDIEQRGKQLAPAFSFIDPFGFSGFPLDLLGRLLANPKTEVFVNLMVDNINRFLEHPNPKIGQHIERTFGTPTILQLPQASTDREADICALYQRQLSRYAKYVRYFRMCHRRDQGLYYLFFASNHPLGHTRMKEAFWKVDPNSGFSFSDATDPGQMVLFDSADASLPGLADELATTFGRQRVAVERVQQHVEERTAFIGTHMRQALKLLEQNGTISVEERKLDGKPRRKNTFPENAMIQFD